MAEYTEKQLEQMVYSKKFYRREQAALHGFGLEVLVDDENPNVRSAVALQGYGLEKLVHDDDWLVKMAVAKQGYGLERYVNDASGLVRRVVAEHGYRLDLLLNDPFPDTRAAARAYVFERLPIEYRALVYVPLVDIGLSRRIVNALLPGSPGGLRTLGDLMMVPAEALERFPGLGEKSHRDIQDKFVTFFDELKDSPWAFGAFETAEDIFDALKAEVEKIVGASVDDRKWFIRTIFSEFEKEKGLLVADVLADATIRSEGSVGNDRFLDEFTID